MSGVKIWVISGLVYLILVIGGYSFVTGANPLTSGEMNHGDHDEQNEQQEDANGHDGHNNEDSEVATHLSYENGTIEIHLEDKDGHAPELLETHERFMHLIIVSDNFEDYHHYHPNQLEVGLFEAETSLVEGRYYAFVDIKPKNKSYTIESIVLEIGDVDTLKPDLTTDEEMSKIINGKEVELSHTSLTTEAVVTFTFDLKNNIPQPYLGALGHVVIIDENVEKFIHVHPVSLDETVFEAHFTNPGKYKLWAEFNFEDEGVIVYPYSIEIN